MVKMECSHICNRDRDSELVKGHGTRHKVRQTLNIITFLIITIIISFRHDCDWGDTRKEKDDYLNKVTPLFIQYGLLSKSGSRLKRR